MDEIQIERKRESLFQVIMEWPVWFRLFSFVFLIFAVYLTYIFVSFIPVLGFRMLTNGLVDQFTRYVPINEFFANFLFFGILLIFVFFSLNIFSISANKRKFAIVNASVFLALYNLTLGILVYDHRIDPITGDSKKCYSISNGQVTYSDLVKGQERQFNPVNGKRCEPVTPQTAEMLAQFEAGIRPSKIPNGSIPILFDTAIGDPIVFYSKLPSGLIELFDGQGFHPETGDKLVPVTSEVYEQWKKAHNDAAAKAEAERLAAVEQENFDRMSKEIEEAAQVEHKVQEEKAIREAAARVEEIGSRCDQLTGNEFDDNRNKAFAPAAYKMLQEFAQQAIVACEQAVATEPNQPRYRYQLARVLQSNRDVRAKSIYYELVD